MKRSVYIIPILMLLLVSCSGSTSDDHGSGVQELGLNERVSGEIASEGEVDWYHYRAVEANNILQVRCTTETLRPDVDILVGLYQLDTNGNKTMIYADHAPVGSVSPVDLTLNTYINEPKDIYIAVRDLMDDDASENPYYLSLDFAGVPEGNDNFAQAAMLEVDAETCPTDSIDSIGDIDCYYFTSTGGIYDVNVEFSAFSGTQVQLSVSLYDSEGNLIENQSRINAQSYHLIHYLASGGYYIEIDDYGRDHFDSASTYQVCVNGLSAAEANGNDSMDTATPVALGVFNQDYAITGALDYTEDQDWYYVTVPSVSAGFSVLRVGFAADVSMEYDISLFDADENQVLSHSYMGGARQYQTQIKLDSSDYYLVVKPGQDASIEQSSPYDINLMALEVSDGAEVSPNDNDTIQTADELSPTSDTASATPGKIGYRGDVDWYRITIPAHADPQILEVYFTAPISQVQYCVAVMGSRLEKTLTNLDAATSATNMKTSLMVEPDTAEAVYTFKVYDYQDDNGDDITYTIRTDLKDIPDALPALAAGSPPYGATVEYYNDATETNDETITLELNSVTSRTYGVNTTFLDFDTMATIEEDVPETGLSTVTFPWIAGYIDYQDDQDYFLIDIQPLDDSDSWYYEISVDLYAPAGDVEYVWKFYPDRNDNEILADRTSGYDGFMASAGDTGINAEVLNITTPAEGENMFWVGRPWRGPAYFSISDFNYLVDESGGDNTLPDEDWGGYDSQPYYFRVNMIYHTGESYPPN